MPPNENFERLRKHKPLPGSVIQAKDGRGIPVHVDGEVMYVNLLIDPECTGWYLVDVDEQYCLKALILPKAQQVLKSRGQMIVFKLRVVRHSQKGTSLICELGE